MPDPGIPDDWPPRGWKEKDAEGEAFQELVEYAVKSLETSTINKATAGVDMSAIDRQIKPFEGEHWEGVYGFSGSANEKVDKDEWDSSPSLSPLNSDDLALDDDDDDSSDYDRPSKQFEDLRTKQYWRDEWHTDASIGSRFDIGNPSSLGPTVARVLAQASGFKDAQAMLQPERYINEDDMVREILMVLQGNKNIVLTWKENAFRVTPTTPSLQESIITSLARTATTAEQLRRFSRAVFDRALSPNSKSNKATSTRTCEAFADAIDEAVRGFDAWCAKREEAMCPIRDEYETSFEVLLDIVYRVFQLEPGQDITLFDQIKQKRQPAALTALLLDTLFSNVQQHMERGDKVTSDALMRVFVRTAEPVWGMVGRWLKDGMGLGLGVGTGGKSGMADELDDEFFIESSGVGIGMMGMGLMDPEFWKEGYALREGVASYGDSDSPEELVLETGKAVGLMRALGQPPLDNAFSDWKSCGGNVGLFSVSVDTLSRLIYDGLLPHYQATGMRLVKVLIDDCGLWKHLAAIEDLFLMRKGDAMNGFRAIMGDFHFLNAAFADVIESNTNAGGKEWINATLVRLSYRGGRDKDRSIKRTVKAIDGLALEYAVPFPLTYIFQPRIMQGYTEVFTFLMQIRRAKSVMERILVRDERKELKVFYAMRSRLSWFINKVIHAEVSRFHEAFHKTQSLDDMIQLHETHLEKIKGRCLLKPNTSALHRTILSILDMCLQFSEGFVAFAGDTTATLDVSRQSIIMKRHRSRRQRRQRKNVIGFSQYVQEDDESSDEEELAEDAGLENIPPEPSYSMLGTSTSSGDEDFYGRVERMSSELDGLVRFLRRGVESLAGGTSEAAPAFGVLAFSLEDWDI
ncbi:Spc98 family-domain-containing protein [Pholiota molesta]|nr:Spc98 family-domain-containing protein [Pholiota molesta]